MKKDNPLPVIYFPDNDDEGGTYDFDGIDDDDKRKALFEVTYDWGVIFVESTNLLIVEDLKKIPDGMHEPCTYYNKITKICFMDEIERRKI